METKSREQGKIRKRGNSSSSSSSLTKKYRFKRAILVGKRGGSTTPVPLWNTTPPKSPSLTMPKSNDVSVSVSARKLAATLWEINSPNSDLNHEPQTLKNTHKVAKFPHLSDPSYTPISQKMDRSRGGNVYNNSRSNSSLMEIETYSKPKARRGCTKTRLKDISNGLKASKELLRVLNRIWGINENNSSVMSLVSALSIELDRARIQINQLIKEHNSKSKDLEYFLKQFEEEKAAWKRKERERIEVEKKLRRQTERLNKKLAKELADTKECLLQVSKELEGEKRAKEILEQVCDELAQGIGEDRAQVEKAREEVEKERQMLQLADVLREERVQMKLSEAKYHFEEKNEALERLRTEIEGYFRQKVENGDERMKELKAKINGIEEIGDIDGDDIADSDLHSIELNMDNSSKSYKWSYANDNDGGGIDDNSKRVSVDRDFKGRKSISENIQWGSICLQRKNSHIDGPDWDFIAKKQQTRNILEPDLQFKARDQRQHFASPTKQWGQTILTMEDNGEVSDSSPVLQGDSLKCRGTRKSQNSRQ